MKKYFRKGDWIPNHIKKNPKVKKHERVLLAEIESYQNNKKTCFASNHYFADILEVSPNHVSKMISSLKARGIIKCGREQKYDRTTHRTIFSCLKKETTENEE